MSEHTKEHFAPKVEITSPEDVAKLGWIGNAYSDNLRFKAVDQYVKNETNKEKQKKALYFMSLHGMGIDEEVTDEELEDYLDGLSTVRW